MEIDRNNDDRNMYNLPDGRSVQIGAARFRAPEALFDPMLIGDESVGAFPNDFFLVHACRFFTAWLGFFRHAFESHASFCTYVRSQHSILLVRVRSVGSQVSTRSLSTLCRSPTWTCAARSGPILCSREVQRCSRALARACSRRLRSWRPRISGSRSRLRRNGSTPPGRAARSWPALLRSRTFGSRSRSGKRRVRMPSASSRIRKFGPSPRAVTQNSSHLFPTPTTRLTQTPIPHSTNRKLNSPLRN